MAWADDLERLVPPVPTGPRRLVFEVVRQAMRDALGGPWAAEARAWLEAVGEVALQWAGVHRDEARRWIDRAVGAALRKEVVGRVAKRKGRKGKAKKAAY